MKGIFFKNTMSTYLFIKLIAFITMAIDHIGCLPISNSNIFRIIGRISFPLFCLLIGYGLRKENTNSLKKVIKLAICFIVSLPIYVYYFETESICFLFGYILFILGIMFINKMNLKNTLAEYLMIIILMSLSLLLNISYDIYLIILCYLFYKCKNKYLSSSLFVIITLLYSYCITGFTDLNVIQIYAIFALPFIFLFYTMEEKNKLGVRKKYNNKFITFIQKNLFYILYPLHLGILLLIKIFCF